MRAADWPWIGPDYATATTPLYHLVAARVIPGREPDDLRAARWVTVALATGVVAGWLYLAARLGLRPVPVVVLVTLVHPNIFWFCFLAMTEIPSLCWGTLGTVALVRLREGILRTLLAAGGFAAAIWTRQIWLFAPLAVAGIAVLGAMENRALRSRSQLLAVAVLTLALAAPIFVAWGGLTPPGHYAVRHTMRFNPAQWLFGLALLGTYFPILGFVAARTRWRLLVFGLAVAAGLVAPFDFLAGWDRGTFDELPQGPMMRFLEVYAAQQSAVSPRLLLAGWIGLGSLTLWRFLSIARQDAVARRVLVVLAALVLVLTVIPETWERYWYATVPLVVLLAERVLAAAGTPRWSRVVTRGYLLLLGVLYFVRQVWTL